MADILDKLVMAVNMFHVVFKTDRNFRVFMYPLEVKIIFPKFMVIFFGGVTWARLLISLRLLSCCLY